MNSEDKSSSVKIVKFVFEVTSSIPTKSYNKNRRECPECDEMVEVNMIDTGPPVGKLPKCKQCGHSSIKLEK